MANMNFDPIVIMRNIETLRSKYQACTIYQMAREMRVAEATLRRAIGRLRDEGLVGYTGVPGSLHVTPSGLQVLLGAPPAPETVESPQETDPAETPVSQDDIDAADVVEADEGDGDEPEPEPEPEPAVKKRAAKKRAPRT